MFFFEDHVCILFYFILFYFISRFLTTDNWNGRSRMSIHILGRDCLERWRFDQALYVKKNYLLHPDQRPIKKAPSNIAGAGDGMFATRAIFKGEILAPYLGDIILADERRFQALEVEHENDGNGVIMCPNIKIRNKRLGLNPYLRSGHSVQGTTSIGIWANHAHSSDPGCNAKLVWYVYN
jgi:hypothetical protein